MVISFETRSRCWSDLKRSGGGVREVREQERSVRLERWGRDARGDMEANVDMVLKDKFSDVRLDVGRLENGVWRLFDARESALRDGNDLRTLLIWNVLVFCKAGEVKETALIPHSSSTAYPLARVLQFCQKPFDIPPTAYQHHDRNDSH